MKRILALLVAALSLSLFGCAGFYFPFPVRTTTATTAAITGEGTFTYLDGDYYAYPYYSSPNYHLNNVDAYNDVLLATRNHIRRVNVQVHSTVYRIGQIFPGITQTLVEASSSGSGVVFLDRDGYYYVLTNHHVIDDLGYTASYEIIAFGDDEAQPAELVCQDADLDLAVLRFAKQNRTTVELIDWTTRLRTRLTPGELVLAVGNPLSVENNVTFGEFIALETIENAPYKVLYHSATIHEGSSGGALVDLDGNLLGINAWGSEDSDEESFAIPVQVVYVFLANNGLAD
ncbi:MAG: trypsin-like peptidase domain-containing protein [Candidatus Izemoplasmatales bacterium]